MKFTCLRFFTTVIAILTAQSLMAQEVLVKGSVIDSVSRQPIAGVTINIINNASTTRHQALTNDKGIFEISVSDSASQILEISHTGYITQKINLGAVNQSIDLGTILLNPSIYSLSEVIVEGKRAPLSFKIDKQIYKASQFGSAANGTAADVLKNLPSVSANAQGELTFRGSSSFLVLLNGKPTQGDVAFVLSQMPASAVENIEVITSPSAAYDADGRSGVINIITKAGVEDGWMVQANLMKGTPPLNNFDNQRYSHPQRYGADISAGYRKGKWDFNGGVNYLRNDIAGFREGDVYTIIDNIKTRFPSTGERSFKKYNYGARLSVNYQPNAANTLSSSFYIGKKYQSRVADLYYNNSREDLNNGTISYFNYYNKNTQDKEGVFTLANIDYSHQFNEQSKLSFSTLFERAALSGLTTNLNLYYPNISDTIQYTRNPSTNPLNAYRTKLDYTKTTQHGSFQTGYQYRYDTQNGDFQYLTKAADGNDFIIDPLFSSQVSVRNNIHAGYVQYNATLGKLSYSSGLRVEHSIRNLLFLQNNEKSELILTNLFPSAQLRYALRPTTTLKAGYNRRIKRNNNFELNPYPEREHSETLEQGDPHLLPELTGTFEVGLEQTFRGGSFFVTAYHQRILNPIQRVNKIFNDTILNRVFTNAGRATQTGLETNLNLQVGRIWQCNLGGNVYKYIIQGDIFNGQIPIQNQSWVYSINTTQSFTPGHNWLLQLSVNYLSLRATAQGEDGAFLTPHFTTKKTSNNKRWYFQFQWLNIDAGMKISNRQRITTSGANFYTTTNYIYEPDQLQLSIGFNLLRRNRKIELPQSEMGEKEF